LLEIRRPELTASETTLTRVNDQAIRRVIETAGRWNRCQWRREIGCGSSTEEKPERKGKLSGPKSLFAC
jgi:hypothetical protein